MIKFLSHDSMKVRFEFFVLDEFIEKIDAFRDSGKSDVIREGAKDDIRNVEDDANAVVVFLIEVEKVEA